MVSLPSRGQHDWDDEIASAFSTVEGKADSAVASAASAASNATTAIATANAASASAASAVSTAAAAQTAATTASSAAATAQSTANTANAKASRVFHAADYADLPTAVAAASAAGGGVVSLANPSGSSLYTLNAALTIPPGVSLRGDNSKLTDLTRSTIKLNSSTACVKFTGGDARGGIHGGFNIDANATGDTAGAMQVTTVQQVFDGITITNAPGVGLLVFAAQNTEFRSVDVNGCQDNVVLDGGSGGLKFTRCENTSPTRYGLKLYDSNPGGHGYGYQYGPCDNLWDACIFEHYGTSATNLVRIQSGSRNHFKKCGFSVNGATLTDYVIYHSNDDWSTSAVIGANVEFTSCNFHGGATANRPIFYVKGTNTYAGNVLVVNGHSFFQQSTAIFNTDGGTVGIIEDHSNYYATTITAKFGALGGANWFFWRPISPTGIVLATPDATGAWAGHLPLAIRKSTDSTAGSRMYVANDGTHGWCNGTNNVALVTATPDTTNKYVDFSGIKFSQRVVTGVSSQTVSTAGTALTTDCSTIAPYHAIILNSVGTITSWTLSNPVNGQEIRIAITRAGAQTFVWPTNIKWAANTAPSTTPTAATYTTVTLRYNSATSAWYEVAGRTEGVPN